MSIAEALLQAESVVIKTHCAGSAVRCAPSSLHSTSALRESKCDRRLLRKGLLEYHQNYTCRRECSEVLRIVFGHRATLQLSSVYMSFNSYNYLPHTWLKPSGVRPNRATYYAERAVVHKHAVDRALHYSLQTQYSFPFSRIRQPEYTYLRTGRTLFLKYDGL